MRRFRNPAFAPESLERKLNPSGVLPVPADVYVAPPAGGTTTTTTTTIPDGNGDPPIDTPTVPSGPSMPA